MSILFDETEILRIAERIERNGCEFYREVMGMEAEMGPELHKLITKLLKMEEGHIGVFASMIKRIKDPKLENIIFDPYGESADYLQAVADGHVFNSNNDDCLNAKEKFSTIESALEAALSLEKDAITFYLGMIEALHGKRDREIINNIIKEEMLHVAMLSRELMGMKNGSEKTK